MSRPRFLADHDVNDQIVSGVLRREPLIEFVRARHVRLDGRPDAEVLAYAGDHGMILVSHDRRTMTAEAYRRLGAGDHIPGLFLVDQHKPVAAAIEALVLIWAGSEAEEWHDTVVFLPL